MICNPAHKRLMCFGQPSNEAWLRVLPPDVLQRLLASTNEFDLNVLSLLLQYHTVPSPLLSEVRVSGLLSFRPRYQCSRLELLSARPGSSHQLFRRVLQQMTDGLKLPTFLSGQAQLNDGSGLLTVAEVNGTLTGILIHRFKPRWPKPCMQLVKVVSVSR